MNGKKGYTFEIKLMWKNLSKTKSRSQPMTTSALKHFKLKVD